MNKICTVDLWTEQYKNHLDCFIGAFLDGINLGFYDKFVIVKNCNCVIENNINLKISNKHNAVIFYKEGEVVRLLVAERNTNIKACIDKVLNEKVGDKSLEKLFIELDIKKQEIDLNEKPIIKMFEEQIDVCSCDRKELLISMLDGAYTEQLTALSNFTNKDFVFDESIKIDYHLVVGDTEFKISHQGAFLNQIKTRIIPIQINGKITKEDLENLK